jgi:hypothetical protein
MVIGSLNGAWFRFVESAVSKCWRRDDSPWGGRGLGLYSCEERARSTVLSSLRLELMASRKGILPPHRQAFGLVLE